MPTKINYSAVINKIIGKRIPKPIVGTLSGHAAGEPFDKYVYEEVKRLFPKQTFRQYEYLNALFSKHSDVVGHEERNKLIGSPTLIYLLSRGKNATEKWSLENPFEEKQNNTADIIVVHDDCFEIIDVKTRNLAKRAQPPNIISAYKTAKLCTYMIDNDDFDVFSIHYIGLDWQPMEDFMVCVDGAHAALFEIPPEDLYINWAAAMQIQFHVSDMATRFRGTQREWTREYLAHFVMQARRRADDMLERFVRPFEKYL